MERVWRIWARFLQWPRTARITTAVLAGLLLLGVLWSALWSDDGRTYDNCSDARAAGAAPLSRGESGYRPSLDRDRDGVACEADGS